MKIFIFSVLCTTVIFLPVITSKKNVVCYFASWTVYRPGNGNFQITDIDTSLCTHIYFAFIALNPDASIRIVDPWESNDDGKGGFRQLVGLKKQNPDLKVLVSMGGWNEASRNFSIVAADPQLRSTLAENVVSFIEEYGFDGFDIDWEYPGKRDSQYPELDPEDFVALVEELKVRLKPKGLLLTGALSGGAFTVDISYNVPMLSRLFDFFNIMAYDFHGHFEPYVGHIAPLRASPLDVGAENITLNVEYGINYWIEKGADPAKMNLGVATYGRCFTLADPQNTQLYAPTLGGGKKGPYTRQEGFLGYNEICELHADWTYYWDDDQQVPHRVGDDQWVGYENPNSLKLKAEFARSKGLAGMMVWALDTDDFKGICGEKYPLLKAVNKAINNY